MIGGIRLKNVVEKADKGEKLSPSEEKLLDAAVTNMAVNANLKGANVNYGSVVDFFTWSW